MADEKKNDRGWVREAYKNYVLFTPLAEEITTFAKTWDVDVLVAADMIEAAYRRRQRDRSVADTKPIIAVEVSTPKGLM